MKSSGTTFGLPASVGVIPSALHPCIPICGKLFTTGSGISALAAGAPIKMVAPKDGLYVVGDSYYIHKGIPAANAGRTSLSN